MRAKEPLVGLYYEQHVVPRVLFISADPKTAPRSAAGRTMAAVRKDTASALGKGTTHWRETCRLAFAILRAYDPDLRKNPDAIVKYFAHTNSAKCCDGTGEGPKTRFDRCRDFVVGEIPLLEPDVVITQGKWASAVINRGIAIGSFVSSRRPDNSTNGHIRRLAVDGNPALWLDTFHPRNGEYHNQLKRLPVWVKAIDDFCTEFGIA